MPDRLLQLDDVRNTDNPEKIAALFQRLGYGGVGGAQPIAIEDLQLSDRSAEAIEAAFFIADHKEEDESLQVILFQLRSAEWDAPSIASSRMKAIATALAQRPSYFLLVAVNPAYDRLMVVNPRTSFDTKMNIKVSIRKLLIDRKNPTAYDRDRIEAIAARDLSPAALYQVQCEAFDVQKLTKTFYKGYQVLFDHVQAVVADSNLHPYFDNADRLHQFCQRLLGRLLFLYFLQKKAFLAGDRRFFTTQYERLGGKNYYAQVLEPLFFETLNQQRPNSDSQWGKIPYLNGSLFDRDYGVGIQDGAERQTLEQTQLPNSLFDPTDPKSILAFLNGYNFTVSEAGQGDEDAAVDPEMLGTVFENMLAEEERGQSGTFYTPRGIVRFMCRSVLCQHLSNGTGMTADEVEALLDLDPDDVFQAKLGRDQAKALKQALETVTVLDPAVGSGAFLLGMLEVILAMRQVIARQEGIRVPQGSLAISQWKRDIIARNLYGVDINPTAIEIAKLRLWLSLVVDIPQIEDVEPLPNLDYKLMCGDSLISTIEGEHLIPDPRKSAHQLTLVVSPLSVKIQSLIDLERQFYDASGEQRKHLKAEILEAERSVFMAAIAQQQQKLRQDANTTDQNIKQLKRPPKTLKDEKARIVSALAALHRFEQAVLSGERSLTFFQYHLHFRDIFERGGFDVVVGNPPYVRQEKFKELKPALQQEYSCYTGTADLFVYFYEQGINLLRAGGHLTYISSNKYMRAGYGKKLRTFLTEKTTLHQIIDFGDTDVFGAIAYPSIILLQKAKPQTSSRNERKSPSLRGTELEPLHTQALNWPRSQPLHELVRTFRANQFPILQRDLKANGWALESSATLELLEKLRSAGTPLGEYVNGKLYYGIKTGLKEAFVIDQATHDRLIAEHPSSAEVIKPFVDGCHVKRWRIDYQNLWLIFTRRGIDLMRYPAIHEYLSQYKERLTPGVRGGRKWYEIQANIAYWKELEKPKIIYPDIYKHQRFSVDKSNFFPGNTCYFIPTTEYWLCGLLNSACVEWFYSIISSRVRGGYLRGFSDYMKQIPIPPASEADKQAIKQLVQKCLDARGQGVEAWEAEIGDRVAHLYGLSADDLKVIQVDFGDADVFGAIAYPSNILLQKAKPETSPWNERKPPSPAGRELEPLHTQALNWPPSQPLDELVPTFRADQFPILQRNLKVGCWTLESPATLELLEKLRSAGMPLGEYVKGRLYRGVLTGFNEAFVIDQVARDRLIAEDLSSAEVIKPFVRGRDVKRWRIDYQNLWLIFTRRGIDITRYAAIHEYLSQYKERLTPGIKGSRKAGSYKWYEIQDNITYWQEFEKPKIYYQEIATYQSFTWDNTGSFSNNKTFLIPEASYYLLALLNSRITWYFLDQVTVKMAGGAYAMQTIYVSQIPIPPASEADKQPIKQLVQRCLDARGQGVEAWEAEIGDRVAHIYGLSADDLKVIQGEGKD